MLKRGYEWMKSVGIVGPDIDVVQNIINKLLENLYIPVQDDLQWIVDNSKTRAMIEEPINWGDLSCTDVIKVEGEDRYIATIQECAPAECPQLCKYIEDHMTVWGWNTTCVTEW